jgi:hypothetical protein
MSGTAHRMSKLKNIRHFPGGVKLLASVDMFTRALWIMLNEQHIMACTSALQNCTGMQVSS